jgi:hypothetical protein
MRCFALAALFFSAVACESEPAPPPASSDLEADELSLDVELRSNGGLAQIVVTVFYDSGILTLSDTDELLFGPASDPSQRLTHFESERQKKTDDDSEIRRRSQSAYAGEFATDATDFKLVFLRSDGARIESAFTLPAPFALSVPTTPASRAAGIPTRWDVDSGPYKTQLDIQSPCLTQGIVRGFEFDPGAYEVQLADLFLKEGTLDCDLQAIVKRWGEGADFAPELAPPWHPARLEQVRVATFTTVP